MGSLGYADDVTLLSPSIRGLKTIINHKNTFPKSSKEEFFFKHAIIFVAYYKHTHTINI